MRHATGLDRRDWALYRRIFTDEVELDFESVGIRPGVYEADAWEVRPEKFYEYFGADAILYTHIRDWDTKYIVVASSVAAETSRRMMRLPRAPGRP